MYNLRGKVRNNIIKYRLLIAFLPYLSGMAFFILGGKYGYKSSGNEHNSRRQQHSTKVKRNTA